MPTASHDSTALELARELADMRLLHDLSSQLIAEQQIDSLYDRVAGAAMALMRSDFSSMQVLHPDRNGGELRLLAHRGLTAADAERWKWVAHDAATSCGAALRARTRVIVPDMEQSDLIAPALPAFRQAGIRSAQSTPLFSRDGELVGMLTTHWRRVHSPSERELALFDILARQAADLIHHRRGEDRLREAHDVLEQRVADRTREVRDLLARVVQGLEDERHRIARDIHDHVGQQLTALRMNIHLMATSPSTEQSGRTQSLAETLDRTIEGLAWELRPPELELVGLAGALWSLVDEWTARFNVPADCDLSEMMKVRFDRDTESNVYRIAQEALHNVSRHAHASHVDVDLVHVPAGCLLTIRDDGDGFPATARSTTGGRHLGLVNMRERAALIGGTLAIESGPAGTMVRLFIPESSD
ncbi:MAG: GAF domain-containing sensor histidine kinase [Cyanobacteria bacterium]|nr:GAF domain-containing sensor histidine kinase [Cyanobacteriota bacterium]